jgi:hypothetical protein
MVVADHRARLVHDRVSGADHADEQVQILGAERGCAWPERGVEATQLARRSGPTSVFAPEPIEPAV